MEPVHTSVSIRIKLVDRQLWPMFHDQVKYCCRVLFAKLTEDVKYVLTTEQDHAANNTPSLDYNSAIQSK